MPTLSVDGLTCGYGVHTVLRDVSFSLAGGRVCTILGPNGVGKTTLFKTILGFLPPLAGRVLVDGRPTQGMKRSELARLLAYVPQASDLAFGYTVREMVLMGRTPLLATGAQPGRRDEEAADGVIERMHLRAVADRDVTELSGGELQMVLVARALATEARVLIMDEPCASLDMGNQALVLDCISELLDEGVAVLMTTHDPNHALALSSEVLCLDRAGGQSYGAASELLGANELSALYGVPVAVGDLCDSRGRSVRAAAVYMGGERADAGR